MEKNIVKEESTNMNRFKKIAVIASNCIFGLGLLFCLIAFCTDEGYFSFAGWEFEKMITKTSYLFYHATEVNRNYTIATLIVSLLIIGFGGILSVRGKLVRVVSIIQVVLLELNMIQELSTLKTSFAETLCLAYKIVLIFSYVYAIFTLIFFSKKKKKQTAVQKDASGIE